MEIKFVTDLRLEKTSPALLRDAAISESNFLQIKTKFSKIIFSALFFLLLLSLTPWLFAKDSEFLRFKEFDIPGMDLGQSLIEFGRQADVTIVVDQNLIAKKSGRPVVGTYTVEQALSLLLKRSNLSFKVDYFDSETIFRIELAAATPQPEKQNQFAEKKLVPHLEEIVVTGILGAQINSIVAKKMLYR